MNTTYGALNSIPSGLPAEDPARPAAACGRGRRPGRRSAAGPASTGGRSRSLLAGQLASTLVGGLGQRLLDVGLAEDHRLGPGVAEGLPDLDGVRARWAPRRSARPGRRTAGRPGSPRSTRRYVVARSWRIGIWPVVSSSCPSCSCRRGELQELPRGALVLARGVHGDVLGVAERVDLLGRRCRPASGPARRPSRPCPCRPRSPTGRRSTSRPCRRRTRRRGTAPCRPAPRRRSSSRTRRRRRPSASANGRLAVLDQQRAAGLGGEQRVEVEPRLEELARRRGLDRVRARPRSRRSCVAAARNSSYVASGGFSGSRPASVEHLPCCRRSSRGWTSTAAGSSRRRATCTASAIVAAALLDVGRRRRGTRPG